MNERELYDIKFFDYRPLDPETATLLFMQEWAYRMREYNDQLGKTRYSTLLKSFAGFTQDQLKGNRSFNVMIKLRRFADANGLRYYDFWAWATKAHLEMKFKVTFETVFLNKNILAKVLEYRQEHEKLLMITSTSKLFSAEHYRALPVQDEYYDYIVDQVKKRQPAHAVAPTLTRMVGDKVIAKEYLDKSEGASRINIDK